MISHNDVQKIFEKLQELLSELNYYCEYDIPSEPDFDDKLVGLFGSNAAQAIALLDMVDFNDENEQQLLNYLPNIAQNLNTFGSQFLFIEHLKNLQSKFPDVKFAPAIFWSQLNCGFLDQATGSNKPRHVK